MIRLQPTADADPAPLPDFVLAFATLGQSEVFQARGITRQAGVLARGIPGGPPARVVLGSDETVSALHGSAFAAALREASLNVVAITIPAGEEHKTLANVGMVLERMAEAGIDRHDLVVALGGGVPGDLFGFVAASYMRGLRLMQVPTSLVAQVDSSIGGKTGVDLGAGKNLVGAFKHPDRVLVDEDMLSTLPQEEWISGTAEVLKHGVIADADLFGWMEEHAQAWRERLVDAGPTLARAIQVKAAIVRQDERESGLRMHLNYGHTLGHALETEAGYGRVRHGEGVAWGMAVEARLAAALGLSDAAFVRRQDRVLRALGLLRPLPPLDAEAVIARLAVDKKVRAGRIRWLLPARVPGSVCVREDVPLPLVRSLVIATVEGTLLDG